MRRKLFGLAAAIVLGGISLTASAASVFLSPSEQTVTLGAQVSVDLMWDFTGMATLGGGTDFTWDPAALALVDIVFDDNFGTDPGEFDPQLTWCDDEECSGPGFIDSLATGNFNGLGDPGPIYIATITFETLAAGTFLIDVTEDTSLAGSFVSVGNEFYPDLAFGDATINVVSAQVPLPAAAWLMIGGLGALLGSRRRS